MSEQMASKGITSEKIQEALNFVYDKTVNGVVGIDSAAQIAASYRFDDDDVLSAADTLIRWQIAKAASSGFLTGLGGVLTLPVAIPANLFTVIFVQIRMIAALAHMGGHDIKDDRVRALVFSCLVASSTVDVAKDIGIAFTGKLATTAVRQISGQTIKRINQAVGFRLLTKFGEKGVINMGKAIPLLGGVLGGAIDGVTTNIIGNLARDTFIGKSSELKS